MRICVICEGSNPFVAGGVSSWLQELILHMPQHEFIVWAIAAQEKQRGQYKYTTPANIVSIQDEYLDAVLNEPMKRRLRLYRLDDTQKAAIRGLDLTQRTPRTLTDPVAIRAELARVKEQGYAVADEEAVAGIIALAVPIYGPSGGVEAAIGLSMPKMTASCARCSDACRGTRTKRKRSESHRAPSPRASMWPQRRSASMCSRATRSPCGSWRIR
jgi:hypothetical protein